MELPEYKECPHCYAPAGTKADGTCVACGKSRTELDGVDVRFTAVTVEPGHQLPRCCFLCGEYTEQGERLSFSYEQHRSSDLIEYLVGFLPGSTRRKQHRQFMPTCGSCRKQARAVAPLSYQVGVNLRLRVHKRFRAQLEDLNGRPEPTWG